MELDAIIEALGAHDANAVVTALQGKRQPIFQAIFNKGHSEATAKAKTERAEVDAKLKTAEGDLATVRGQLEELQSKAPDVKKLQTEYETKLRETEDRRKKEVADLKAKSRAAELRRTASDLVTRMVAQGVNPTYAKVIAKDEDVLARIKVNDDGVEVMQAGTSIPFAPADGQTGIDLLAAELVKATPAEWIKSSGDGGSGTGGGGSGKGAGGNGKTNFDAIREKAKKEREAKSGDLKSPEEKLGMVAGAA